MSNSFKKLNNDNNENFLLVSAIKEEYLSKRKERFNIEKKWQLNIDFFDGNQYNDISPKGDIIEWDKEFYWQSREVFNHIAPLIESRIAKLSNVRPVLSVRPSSDDSAETQNAKIAESLLKSVFNKISFDNTVSTVNKWCELCGTAFYKVEWDKSAGEVIGSFNNNTVFEGEVSVSAVSPFEIFPDNLSVPSLSEQKSIIHARLADISMIKDCYGVLVEPDDKDFSGTDDKNKVVLIEKYEKPTLDFPDGKLTIVAGNSLLYIGPLPFINGKNNKREYPFVKQSFNLSPNCFFGNSIIERLIPVQRAFNAVKNRKHEFMNRITMGVMTVEDGSVDVDELSEDGLSPGKILVYRQGANPPQMLQDTTIPEVFNEEEEKLLNEFVIISGVSDVMSSKTERGVSSGAALQILVEQDNEKLIYIAENIRRSYIEVASCVLRLYKQFLTGVKAIKNINDDELKTRIYYVDKSVITADEVYIDNENELAFSERQKKELLINMYNSGLLFDENGKLPLITREKLLTLLGYKSLDSTSGLMKLHQDKAVGENEVIAKSGREIDVLDNHAVHIDEHTRFYLGEFENLTNDEKQNLLKHVALHKSALADN